jgi:hypothetical protein
MDATLAKAIVDAVEGSGLEISVYPDYSGRGMYGKTTTGIVTSDDDKPFLVAILQLAYENGVRGDEEEMDHLLQAVGNLRRDEMGQGTIIY